jgi:hypothetical protein
MEQAPHQRVPITVHFGEGARPPLEGVTRRFGPQRVDVALPLGDWAPPRGTPVRFSARLGGQAVEGCGRVAGCSAGPDAPGGRVLDLEVTSLTPEAEVVMRSVGFRHRLEGWIESHPAASADAAALRPREPRPRTRPRARRHHWDLDSRFRPGG